MKLFSRLARSAEPPAPPPGEPDTSLEVASRTHAGMVRSLNEDRLMASADLGLWAIADGMGGHDSGDVAAQAVIDSLAKALPADAGALRSAIERANRALREGAGGSGSGISGATIVALMIRDGQYRCLWAGDSELWLVRDGQAHKLTRDHSVVEELIRSGSLSERDRRSHPYAHVITRAVGVAETLLLDEISGPLLPGDAFLLCSDGLTGAVDPDRFAAIGDGRPLEEAADLLLSEALAAGASDNVTLILVRAPR